MDKREFRMIYIKTELGKTALHDKSLGLSPKQRSSFIMFDGRRTLGDVLKLTTALGVTVDDINRLIALGLLAPVDAAATGSSTDPDATSRSAGSDFEPGLSSAQGSGPTLGDQAQYAKAYPIAVRLTSNLGLRGFRLNLSVESASDLEKLKDLAPKIKEAVGVEKFRELEDALYR
jgi:hypothetical protein